MRGHKPIIENGVVVGNVYNKQTTGNPIAKWLVRKFDSCFVDMLAPLHPNRILEVGCGEGRLTQLLLKHTQASVHGLDVSERVLRDAETFLDSDRVKLEKSSIYDLDELKHGAELVICCEVLEHLEDPRRGLEKLRAVNRGYCLVSVPQEPLWRMLNMLRGAYWRDLGNTPGHVQNWSRNEFIDLVSDFFQIVEIREPLPWTMVLCTNKK